VGLGERKSNQISDKNDMKRTGRFWVIDTEAKAEWIGSKAAVGPFTSYHKAETWLRNDVKELCAISDLPHKEIDEYRTGTYIIVEERNRVQLQCHAEISVRFEKAEEELEQIGEFILPKNWQ
jgi:hypothetical protein